MNPPLALEIIWRQFGKIENCVRLNWFQVQKKRQNSGLVWPSVLHPSMVDVEEMRGRLKARVQASVCVSTDVFKRFYSLVSFQERSILGERP